MGLGGGIALAIAAGAFFFVAPTSAADDALSTVSALVTGEEVNRRGQRGRDGFGGRGGDQTALAEALNITVEALDAAKEEVKAAKVDAAVEAGIITADEAAEIEAGEARLSKRTLSEAGFEFDSEAAMAEALGITVEDLEAAQEQVKADKVAALVEEGVITQEEADDILSGEAEFPGRNRGGRGQGGGRGFGPDAPAADGDDA